MRPAIHSDGLDIARGIESSWGEHGAELFTNMPLENCERRGEKFLAPGPLLIARGQARFARDSLQVQQAGFRRIARKTVLSHADGEIERD